MRVLVACEYSGVVASAFAELGHEAWSCDIKAGEINLLRPLKHRHHQGDAIAFMNAHDWDLLIAHPPCTYLSFVNTQSVDIQKRKEAFEFFMVFVNAAAPKVCVENPQGYPNVAYRKPDQIIHPYYFGDKHMKRTCLWLKGLPKLEWDKTAVVKPTPRWVYKNKMGQTKNCYFTSIAKNGHERSRTFPSIAKAMAQQWGGVP